ncbi:MAG: P-loop NTPase [Dehalococcoidia bacterium]|nr:P-loop NTPase [Dehalococcoidia bacterium]
MRARTALLIDPRGELPQAALAELERAGITVAGTTGYGLDALQTAFTVRPDLFLIGISDPVARPLDLIRRIHDALPDSVIVGVIDASASDAFEHAIAAGAAVCIDTGAPDAAFAPVIDSARQYFERLQRGGSLAAIEGGQVITVLGAKGGVGKTTIATNLAIALERASRGAVALVDADPLFGDVALSMDLNVQSSLADAVADLSSPEPRDIREFMTPCFGISVLPARARALDGALVTGDDLAAVIARLRQSFDFVVIDTGGAFTDLTTAAADAATTRILVTTTELNSVHDAARAIRWLRDRAGQGAPAPQLLQNRAGMRGGLSRPEVERELGVSAVWSVAEDKRLLQAMQAGVPVVERYPNSPAAVAIRGLASSFIHVPGSLRRPPPGNAGRRPLARLFPYTA